MIRVTFLGIAAIVVGLKADAQTRSSVTGEMDKFAIAHLETIQPMSIRENVEYCGLIGRGADGQLVATKATRGGPDECQPDEVPDDLDVVASYHTHGAWTMLADTEVPSVKDLLSDFDDGIDGYIATPSGRVWQVLLEDRKAYLLCGKNCLTADPNHRDCKSLPVAKEYSVATLKTRAAQDDGLC